jgi:exonuclease III
MKRILSDNDIIFLTETWSNENSNMEVEGFSLFCLHRSDKKRNSKRDSGGIACYIKNHLINFVHLYKSDSDDIMWLKFDACLFALDNDMYVCLCYCVAKGSSREPFVEALVFDRILQNIIEICSLTNNECSFLVLGDMNSRIGQLRDYVENDTVDKNADFLPANYVSDEIHLERSSQDYQTNQYGTLLLDFLRQSGLRVMNGRIGRDAGIGKYTFVGSSGCSLIDYVLASINIINLFDSFEVGDPNILSDHCEVRFGLHCNLPPNENVVLDKREINPDVQFKYKWKDKHTDEYLQKLSSPYFQNSLYNLQDNLKIVSVNINIDDNISKFMSLMDEVCEPLFKIDISKSQCHSPQNETHQPWFDEECINKRKGFTRF